MRRLRRLRSRASIVTVAVGGMAALLSAPHDAGAQQQQQPRTQQAPPKPQVRQVTPKPTQTARPSTTGQRREVTKVTRNTGSGDVKKPTSSSSSNAPKPREQVSKPVVRDATSTPKPNSNTANTNKTPEPNKKTGDIPKKLEPIKKPTDAAKVDQKTLDPVKRAGDLTKVDPSKGPPKPNTAGPLGPVPPGPNANKLPLGSNSTPPGGTIPGQKTATPINKIVAPQALIHTPAKGLNIKPLAPPKVASVNLLLFKPMRPPVPPPRLIGPAWYQPAPRFSWYPWGGRKYFPYFFVGTIVTGAVVVAGYNYWTPPPPSCYAGGSTVYYYPGTRVCYDFSVAREDDEFECHGKVFRYRPSRYRTVETMIENEAPSAVPVTTWAQSAPPERKVQVQAAIDRAAARAQTIAAAPLEKLDCSACLAALGPTEGEDGQATVSVVNNCDHDVTVSGGLAKTGAPADTPAVCEFQGDVPAGQEVVACTKPTSDFTEAQVFLNAVVPVAGTAKAAPACRIPDQPKAN